MDPDPNPRTEFRKKQREEFEKSLPMSRELFQELFDYLDITLEDECDDTLRLTAAFLHAQKVENVDEVLFWLNDKGGYCDCEVLANVEELFE